MADSYAGPKTSRYKVWHVPQVPMHAFIVELEDEAEAWRLVNTLAQYDLFQYDNQIKPDYSNVSGVMVWCEEANEYEDLDDPEDDE